MKLKIISNGQLSGTQIVDAGTGETVEGVVSIQWVASMRHDEWFGSMGVCYVLVEFVDLALEVQGEVSQMTIEEFRQRMAEKT